MARLSGNQRLEQALAEAQLNADVTALTLSNSCIESEGAVEIAAFLRNNEKLTALNLKNNSIGDRGAEKLSATLLINTAIAYLNLGCIDISSWGVQQIVSVLETNSTLTHLDLSQNDISDECADDIGIALEKNSTLQFLELPNNNLRADGAERIAAALEKNSTLLRLNMSRNSIGDMGATCIAAALEKNQTLNMKTLVLSCCDIRLLGVLNIAHLIVKNSTLIELDLSGNFVDAQGAKYIAKALQKNETMTSLDLSCNDIGPQGALKLANALERKNFTLKTLNLQRNNTLGQGEDRITASLRKNRVGARVLTARCVQETLEHVLITCIDMSGEEVASIQAEKTSSLMDFVGTLASLLQFDGHLCLVHPDGTILGDKTEGQELGSCFSTADTQLESSGE